MAARLLWTAGVWAFAGLALAAFVRAAAIGPTVFSFDHHRGVHLGDLAACVVFPAYAWWVSRSFWTRPA